MKDVVDTLHDFMEVLGTLKLPYALMGGFAVRVYALPRNTEDIDITVVCTDEMLQEIFRLVEVRGYEVDEVYKRGWKDRVAEMPVVKCKRYVGGRPIDVDIFPCESEFQQSVMKRRRSDDVEGREYWLVTPEDLLLFKLTARRPRDVLDVADIIFVQGQLDEAYLRLWAERLGVLDKLDQALKESREL
jgi:hypothetical protein